MTQFRSSRGSFGVKFVHEMMANVFSALHTDSEIFDTLPGNTTST